MTAWDKDDDNQLSFEEYRDGWFIQQKEMLSKPIDESFDRLDKNGDKVIAKAEAPKVIKRWDANEDNEVSFEEYKSGLETQRAEKLAKLEELAKTWEASDADTESTSKAAHDKTAAERCEKCEAEELVAEN